MEPDKRETQPGYYLTGQVVAAYIQVRLTLQDLGALHLSIFDQPGENEFINRL